MLSKIKINQQEEEDSIRENTPCSVIHFDYK